MSKLINELKSEHQIIAETFKRINTLGIGTTEGQQALLSAKKLLVSHLQKEDKHLYPLLNQAAKTDANLKQTLETYANDMDEISKAAEAFFDKYRAGGSGLEFSRDFGRLFANFSQRMRKEEISIYRRYDELAK